MSLQQRISDLTTRVATEFKVVKNLIAGNTTGSLAGLITTAKGSLLAAINEVKGNVNDIINAKGAANGFASLDAGGKVPAAQLPGFVDDIIEVANFAALPAPGVAGVLYVTLDTNLTYRYGGSAYVEVSQSLALGETSGSAYRGDRGKAAYDHSQITDGSNPHGTTFANLAGKPTTIAGFGITDAYTKIEIGDNEKNFVTEFEAAL